MNIDNKQITTNDLWIDNSRIIYDMTECFGCHFVRRTYEIKDVISRLSLDCWWRYIICDEHPQNFNRIYYEHK